MRSKEKRQKPLARIVAVHSSLELGNWSFPILPFSFAPTFGNATPINSRNKTMSTGAPSACFHPNQFTPFIGRDHGARPFEMISHLGPLVLSSGSCQRRPFRVTMRIEPCGGLRHPSRTSVENQSLYQR